MQFEFSNFVLDTDTHSLTRAGKAQPVEPQVFDLLLLLLENAGTLVTKEQLIDEIWGGRIVSESAISARIAAARKAVGDDGKQQAVIRTVARRGLQFVAELANNPAPNTAPLDQAQTPRIRYATAEDGVKIAFAVSGSGPPLLRVGHFPSHLELEWTEPTERTVFDALSAQHTLIRVDFRGSGLSDLDVDDFSISRCAKDVKAVVDALGLDQFAVYGSSSGAMVAVEFAVMFPEHVSHLITLGGYVDGRSVRQNGSDSASGETLLKMAEEGWETPGSPFVTGYLSIYCPTASPEQLLQIAKNMQSSCPIENGMRARAFANSHSIADLLDQVQVKTLVIHSRGDIVHPLSEGQKLARGIANAQLMVLESHNHYPMPEEPCWQTQISAILEFAIS